MTSLYSHYARPGLYCARGGVLLGVCKGLAEYFDLSVFWTRLITFGAFVLTGFFPTVFIYVLAALLMQKEPRWADCY